MKQRIRSSSYVQPTLVALLLFVFPWLGACGLAQTGSAIANMVTRAGDSLLLPFGSTSSSTRHQGRRGRNHRGLAYAAEPDTSVATYAQGVVGDHTLQVLDGAQIVEACVSYESADQGQMFPQNLLSQNLTHAVIVSLPDLLSSSASRQAQIRCQQQQAATFVAFNISVPDDQEECLLLYQQSHAPASTSLSSHPLSGMLLILPQGGDMKDMRRLDLLPAGTIVPPMSSCQHHPYQVFVNSSTSNSNSSGGESSVVHKSNLLNQVKTHAW